MPNESYRQGVAAWLAPVRQRVRPLSEGYFAGALDFSKVLLTFNTLLMRLVVAFGLWSQCDHRDWDAIYAWVESLRPLLDNP